MDNRKTSPIYSSTSSGSGPMDSMGTAIGGLSHQSGQADKPLSSRSSKFNQIIQNYYVKAAQIIIDSRVNVTPYYLRGTTTKKTNRWFNLELDDSEMYREDLQQWKTADYCQKAQPLGPIIIDIVLDTKDLSSRQALMMRDAFGNWNPLDVNKRRRRAITLERWTIDIERLACPDAPDPPVIYKKAIVLFRSLYMLTRQVPAWKLRKRLLKSPITNSSLKIKARIRQGGVSTGSESSRDLDEPLLPGVHSVETVQMSKIETPVGYLSVTSIFQRHCDFDVGDAETLLSSQFAHLDRQGTQTLDSFAQQLAYRSPPSQASPHLATTSKSSPIEKQLHPPSSLSSQRSDTCAFIPFKSPSVSSNSPTPSDFSPSLRVSSPLRRGSSQMQPSSRNSSYKDFTSEEMHGDDRRPALERRGSASSGRGLGLAAKYSSSFGQRNPLRSVTPLGMRPSSRRHSSTSRHEDDVSDRGSLDSASIDTDDVGDFVRLLDSRNPLKGDATSEQNSPSAALKRFLKLRDTHNALTDSISASVTLPKHSVGSSVRTNTSVPGMLPGTAYSSSSSPGRAFSPHTPAIPSRLSEGITSDGDIIQQEPLSTARDNRSDRRSSLDPIAAISTVTNTNATTSPLDIPSSPLPYRRILSAGPRHTSRSFDEENIEGSLEHQAIPRRHSSSLGNDPLLGARRSANALQCSSDDRNKSPRLDSGDSPGTAAAHGSHRDAKTSLSYLGSIRHLQDLSVQSSAGTSSTTLGGTLKKQQPPPRSSSSGSSSNVAKDKDMTQGTTTTPSVATTHWGSVTPSGSINSLERRASTSFRSGSTTLRAQFAPPPAVDDEELLFAMTDMTSGSGLSGNTSHTQ